MSNMRNNNHTPQPPTPRCTLEDGITLWRARDVYRLRRGVESVVLVFLLLEAIGFILRGRWDLVLTVIGLQVAMLWGFVWLVRQAWQWARGRGHGLVVFALLGLTLCGCESMARGLAKINGVQVDPLPGPCAPESYQAQRCLEVQKVSASALGPVRKSALIVGTTADVAYQRALRALAQMGGQVTHTESGQRLATAQIQNAVNLTVQIVDDTPGARVDVVGTPLPKTSGMGTREEIDKFLALMR